MSISLIKKLGLAPPNELTPFELAQHFQNQRYAYLEQNELAGLKAVGGSKSWLGYSKVGKGTNSKIIAIVGKGITFDSGGISLKPREDMHHMKMDMLGAATVLALAKDLSKSENTHYLYGCCAENTFHQDTMRPGDVIKYKDGTKVEIIDTDAEGRLVLADGILVAKENNPDLIITIATLTGLARAALGDATAILGNNQKAINLFMAVAKECNEEIWQLPIWEQHRQNIKGIKGVSDIKNLGTIAGASTAAAFLEHFVGNIPWIHLDIAGSAYKKEIPTGAMYKTIKKYLEKNGLEEV